MDWQPVLTAFLQVFLIGLITAFVPPAIAYLKAKAADLVEGYMTDLDWLKQIAQLAVKAAEQANVAGLIENKKDYALSIAEDFLEAKGFDFDLELISAAIEAAVLEAFNGEKPADVGFPE